MRAVFNVRVFELPGSVVVVVVEGGGRAGGDMESESSLSKGMYEYRSGSPRCCGVTDGEKILAEVKRICLGLASCARSGQVGGAGGWRCLAVYLSGANIHL